jgi:hypothetical protein
MRRGWVDQHQAPDMDRRSFLAKAVGAERWELQTRLTAEECAARLGRQVWSNPLREMLLAIPTDLIGDVDGYDFHLRWARRQNMPRVRGRFVRVPEGTRVEVRLGLAPGGMIAYRFGPVFIVAIWIVLILKVISGDLEPIGLLLLTLFFAFMALIYARVLALARHDKRAYIDFLRQALDAEIVVGPLP